MEQKAFDLIADRAQAAFDGLGYRREAADAEQDGPIAVFVGEDAAYGILYAEEKKQVSLRVCGLEEGKPDGNWKSLSTWLYDPETDPLSQVQEIVDDFVETVTGPKRKAQLPARKKRKKDDESNVDPLFFFNRFAGVFPELRDELAAERASYGDVRAVTFARERLLPRLEELLASPGQKDRTAKCAGLLNNLYGSGDLDVRSIITIVLLNGLSDSAVETLRPLMGEELAKAFRAALKMKGKTVKPEKKKKKKKFMASTLADR